MFLQSTAVTDKTFNTAKSSDCQSSALITLLVIIEKKCTDSSATQALLSEAVLRHSAALRYNINDNKQV